MAYLNEEFSFLKCHKNTYLKIFQEIVLKILKFHHFS